jgi:hypothetical protein
MMDKYTTIWVRRDIVDRLRPLKQYLEAKYTNRKEASWSDVLEYLLDNVTPLQPNSALSERRIVAK